MAKIKTSYICQGCGNHESKWLGQCPSCKEWNTLVEEIINSSKQDTSKVAGHWNEGNQKSKPIPLSKIQSSTRARIDSGDAEFNRVLGGGIVPGSITLIGGHPGIGKSTLLLQIALSVPLRVLYVSGEESEEQIKMRAQRISDITQDAYIYSETDTLTILAQAKKTQAELVIIDSIQTLRAPGLESAPGSVTQIRESTAELQRFAKETNTPVIIIGHINKDGAIAGPKILEHIVDTVLQFEGDGNYRFRILRSIKNRFGSTDQLGIYEMASVGLRIVENPSAMLLDQHHTELSGSSIASTMEGARPLLIETQALVTTAIYGTPQRSATGFDLRRMSMLLAVLEKRGGFRFGTSDVFLNIAGGIKISDPSLDLAICASLVSSLQDLVISKKICVAGEIGLSGEVRAISRAEQRIQEADRLGFSDIFMPFYNVKSIDQSLYKIRIHPVKILSDVFEGLLG